MEKYSESCGLGAGESWERSKSWGRPSQPCVRSLSFSSPQQAKVGRRGTGEVLKDTQRGHVLCKWL